MVGVAHDESDIWPSLTTHLEIELVRQEIENAGRANQFLVDIDPLGDWNKLVARCKEIGPPHVFHFAGHGLEHGRGLVFRGEDGGPEEVSTEPIARLLARRVKERQARLIFLNACTTTSKGKGPFQPFGGLGEVLIEHGIPMVVGLQTPVEDTEAVKLAQHFYSELSRGASVDCALQEAREELSFLPTAGVGWAFLNLTISGKPVPLCSPESQNRTRPSASMTTFGHELQRQRLERFLGRRSPMVIIVHGEERSGQRYVLDRVKEDIERAGNILWRPVAALHSHKAGEPLLRPAQLSGEIARAIGISDEGTQEELVERLAKELAERCSDDRVVIIDLQEVLQFHTKEQAEAVPTLIQDIWAILMTKAAIYRSSLPVFLLVSIASPRPLSEEHPKAKQRKEMAGLTEKVIHQLKEKPRLHGNVRVEVLPELEPFSEDYIAGFLEDVLELDPDRAEQTAEFLTGFDNDNETILERLEQVLEDLEQA